MAVVIDVKNPIEVREIGLKALNMALGPEGTQAFIDQYEGMGDFTKERQEMPEPSFDEFTARIKNASAEIRARRLAVPSLY
jgi:hypothetical protein